MSLVVDKCRNIIVNEGGIAHATGYVLIEIDDEKGARRWAVAKGQGRVHPGGKGFLIEAKNPVLLREPLTLTFFKELTGWFPESDSVCYLWMAEQTEPAMHGRLFEATSTKEPPAPVEPAVDGGSALIAESLYGPWQLLGTVKGRVSRTRFGETVIQMATPRLHGQFWTPTEVWEAGFYSRA